MKWDELKAIADFLCEGRIWITKIGNLDSNYAFISIFKSDRSPVTVAKVFIKSDGNVEVIGQRRVFLHLSDPDCLEKLVEVLDEVSAEIYPI